MNNLYLIYVLNNMMEDVENSKIDLLFKLTVNKSKSL